MARVGFIGVGRMGSALLTGFIEKGLIKPESVRIYDRDPHVVRRMNLRAEYSAFEVVEKSEIIFICVKPKDMDDVLDEIRDIAGSRLIVSIAAGIPIRRIEAKLREARVVRVMPNTPAMVGEMAAAYSMGRRALEEDAVLVGSLLNSVGVAYPVAEELLDAVTGLSGSGPAYAYYFIQALIEGGVREGLPDEIARNLAIQTVRGAAGMASASSRPLPELIDDVRSPGGTTAEGLKTLDERKVHESVAEAVQAAARRSRQLGG